MLAGGENYWAPDVDDGVILDIVSIVNKENSRLKQPAHRVTGGGRPPPIPTERGVRISRTRLLRRRNVRRSANRRSDHGGPSIEEKGLG